MVRQYFLLLFFLFTVNNSISQELNCRVKIDFSQVPDIDKKVFETLELALTEYMNNTRWTQDNFRNEERIECNMLLIISAAAVGDFSGSMQVQSRRPVFKSGYNSTIFNYNDDNIQFKYVEFQNLEFNPTQHTSNLTSLLAFYAYIILGFDYDSFSLEGGTPYFTKAQTIVNNVQSAGTGEKGWSSFDDKSRYWLIENLTKQALQPVREVIYKYHRIGLDNMASDAASGRTTITQCLEILQKTFKAIPGAYIFQVFFSSKNDELINIYSGALPDEKSRVIPILTQLDPTNTGKYQKINKS